MTNKDYDRLTFQHSRHGGMICGIGLKANSEDEDFAYVPQTIYQTDYILELLQKYRKQDRMAFANYIKNTLVNYVFVMDELPEGSDRIMYYKDALGAVDRALKETTLWE